MSQHTHPKILIFGGPGAGSTTLGRELASSLCIAHFDTDDFYWIRDESGLQFRKKRNAQHRLAFMLQSLAPHPEWILSGPILHWGESIIPQITSIFFLEADWTIRKERIQKREKERYGDSRILPGGDLNLVYEKFLKWAEEYDTSNPNQRTKEQDQTWLKRLSCPIFHLNSSESVEKLRNEALAILKSTIPL